MILNKRTLSSEELVGKFKSPLGNFPTSLLAKRSPAIQWLFCKRESRICAHVIWFSVSFFLSMSFDSGQRVVLAASNV